MGRNNDYMAGNLLDYKYFSKHCRLIAIDLSKNIELENPDLKKKLILLEYLKEQAIMFFIIYKSEDTIFEFSQNEATVA